MLSIVKKKPKPHHHALSAAGFNNYFLLPSSLTLSAAPSLEIAHETHICGTKHETRGVRLVV